MWVRQWERSKRTGLSFGCSSQNGTDNTLQFLRKHLTLTFSIQIYVERRNLWRPRRASTEGGWEPQRIGKSKLRRHQPAVWGATMPTETRINQISFQWFFKYLSKAQEPISKLFQPTSSDNPRFCPGIVPVKVSSKLGHNLQGTVICKEDLALDFFLTFGGRGRFLWGILLTLKWPGRWARWCQGICERK